MGKADQYGLSDLHIVVNGLVGIKGSNTVIRLDTLLSQPLPGVLGYFKIIFSLVFQPGKVANVLEMRQNQGKHNTTRSLL